MGVVNGLGRLTIFVRKTLPQVVSKALPQMFGWVLKWLAIGVL